MHLYLINNSKFSNYEGLLYIYKINAKSINLVNESAKPRF